MKNMSYSPTGGQRVTVTASAEAPYALPCADCGGRGKHTPAPGAHFYRFPTAAGGR